MFIRSLLALVRPNGGKIHVLVSLLEATPNRSRGVSSKGQDSGLHEF